MAKTVRYQNALRAIGQGLERLEVESFELESSDGHWVVSGECTKPKTPHSSDPIGAKSFLGFIRTIGQKKTKQNSGSQTFHFFGLRFDQVKVDLLDRQGRVLRANVDDCMLNPHSISQALRSAGADLDHRENRLLKLSWRQQTLTLCYANGLGVETRQVFTPADLYNLWVHQFKQRSQQTGAD